MTPEETGYGQGVAAFWMENDPDTEHSELMVCDPGMRVCGRLDWIGTLRAGPYAGQRVILDAKTSGFIPTKHHVQIAGYQHCAQASGYGAARGLILQVRADGTYALIPAQADAVSFANAVAVYRDAARIGSAARKAAA